MIHPDTKRYNDARDPADRAICHRLAEEIDRHLPEAAADALGHVLASPRPRPYR